MQLHGLTLLWEEVSSSPYHSPYPSMAALHDDHNIPPSWQEKGNPHLL